MDKGMIVEKFGIYMGKIKLRKQGQNLLGTFIKSLEGNGVKEKDECEIFYKDLGDGRYAVTFVKTEPKAKAFERAS